MKLHRKDATTATTQRAKLALRSLCAGLAVGLAATLAANATGGEKTSTADPAAKLGHKELGIPLDAEHVVVLTQAAHNDYDWLCAFNDFFGQSPTDGNQHCARGKGGPTWTYGNGIEQLFDVLFEESGKPAKALIESDSYWYQACEMSFLRRYFQDSSHHPMPDLGNLRIMACGMTSPSSLVSNGEAFIRNFLVGDLWVTSALPPYESGKLRSRYAWLPDDFALDPELPAILSAMDLAGIGFSRMAGENPGGYDTYSCLGEVEAAGATRTTWIGIPESNSAQLLPVGVPLSPDPLGNCASLSSAWPAKPPNIGQPRGTELTWQAGDGSEVFTRYMPAHYGQLVNQTSDYGTDRKSGTLANAVGSIPTWHKKQFGQKAHWVWSSETGKAAIEVAFERSRWVATTRYVHVPISGDQMVPIADLLTEIAAFNDDHYCGSNNPEAAPCKKNPPEKTWAVLGTFDHFADLTRKAWGNDKHLFPGSFVTTPVIDGFYGTATDVKQDQTATTLALTGAETFAAILHDRDPAAYTAYRNHLTSQSNLGDIPSVSSPDGGAWGKINLRNQYPNDGGVTDPLAKLGRSIEAGWEALAPSTHHAYVVGLSPAQVYRFEQQPLIQGALAIGEDARADAVGCLAGSCPPAAECGDGLQAAVFNPLGLARSGQLAELQLGDCEPPAGDAVQLDAEGHTALFLADAPSMGYRVAGLESSSSIGDAAAAKIEDPAHPGHFLTEPATLAQSVDSITFQNGLMKVELRRDGGEWTLSKVLDGVAANSPNVLAGKGNRLLVYEEGTKADVFRFSWESVSDPAHRTFEACAAGGQQTQPQGCFHQLHLDGNSTLEVLETGPVRVRLRVTTKATENTTLFPIRPEVSSAETLTYTQEYLLVAGEPMLRMKTSGQAPSYATVMTTFPLTDTASPIETVTYGTPYHWRQDPVQPSWGAYADWQGPFFKGTFNFVIPEAKSGNLATVYHPGVTGWSGFGDTLYGILWRNVTFEGGYPTQNNSRGKPENQITEYALRLPLAKQGRITRAFIESLAYQAPLIASLPEKGRFKTGDGFSLARFHGDSLAALSHSAGTLPPALLRVAKRGSRNPDELILRAYDPHSSTGKSVSIELGVELSAAGETLSTATPVVCQVSALEKDIVNQPKSAAIHLTSGPGTVTYDSIRSLTTLKLPDPAGSCP